MEVEFTEQGDLLETPRILIFETEPKLRDMIIVDSKDAMIVALTHFDNTGKRLGTYSFDKETYWG